MAKRFDQILDECTDRILLHNGTVEECLSLYPEYAAELEPQLGLIAMAGRAYAFAPSPVAKARGRQRLQQVMRELEDQERTATATKKPWGGLPFGLQPRWAMAVAAVVIALLVGGGSTVAASAGSLPGQTLYPVKRTTELARLALELSQTGKAQLHLAYAERRAGEIGALVRAGETQPLDEPVTSLQQNLAAVARITGAVEDQETVISLKSLLDSSASQVLANLQAALHQAPEAAERTATGVFQASSAAYGSALETVAPRAPDRYASAAPGVLQLWAVDPPPPNVEKLLLEVGKIEAHLVAGPDSQWVTITQEPQTFDLLRISTVQRLLGEQMVKPGTYTRVRFRINNATVVAGGKQHQAKVPSDALSLQRPFRVEEGQTTVVLLNFVGLRSLRVTGQGEFILTPQVRVFAREAKRPERLSEKEERREREKKPDGRERDRALAPGEGGPQDSIDLEGTIEELTADSLAVRGKRITITPDSQIDPAKHRGQPVKIEAAVQPDGSLLVTKVEAKSGEEEGEDIDKAKVTAIQVRGLIESLAPTETPPKPPDEKGKRVDRSEEERQEAKASQRDDSPRQRYIRITGNIEFVSLARWTVRGQEVLIGPETEIEGTPAVGFPARVEGVRLHDGRALAVSIKIGKRHLEMDEAKQPSTQTPPDFDRERPEHIRISGAIVELGASIWRVDGHIVLLTGQTKIEGIPQPGARVEVQGVRQSGGAVQAVRIRVLPARTESDKPRQPPPTPLPVPTPAPRPKLTPSPVHVQLEGVLELIQGPEWRVGGHVVLIDAETEIEGIPVVGSKLRIEGVRRGDGTILVKKVKVR